MFGLSEYPDAILRGVALGVIALIWVIVLVRTIGLRTFSKMTAFDFVIDPARKAVIADRANFLFRADDNRTDLRAAVF